MTPQALTSQQAGEDEIDLSEIWAALLARKGLVFGGALLGTILAAVLAFIMTPIYRSEVVVAVMEDGPAGGGLASVAGQFGGLASLAGVGLDGSNSRAEYIGTLKSRQIVETYIDKNRLLPALYYDRWDESRNAWKPSYAGDPTLWKATKFFTEDIRSINEDKKSGLVTLGVEWHQPELAMQWATGLVQLANESLRQRSIEKSERNLAYLNAELEKTSVVELRQAIYRLIEAEIKSVMVAKGNAEFAFKIIDPAVTPEKKIKPRRGLIIVLGFVIGLTFSALLAIVQRPRRFNRLS